MAQLTDVAEYYPYAVTKAIFKVISHIENKMRYYGTPIFSRALKPTKWYDTQQLQC